MPFCLFWLTIHQRIKKKKKNVSWAPNQHIRMTSDLIPAIASQTALCILGHLVVFDDFNIHLDKLYAANFHSLLASFDLKRLTTTSTHKSDSQLDLIYTRNSVADNVLEKHLHTTDHYLITFNLLLATSEPPTPLPVTFSRNLRSLSSSHISSVVSSSLPSPIHFSALDANVATDILCPNLTSCLHNICPLSSRPARAALLTPGYPMFFMNIALNSGQQRENVANQKICQIWVSISLCFHVSLLKSTLPRFHTSTTRSTAHLAHAISSKHSPLSPSTTAHHLLNSRWLCHFLHKQN